MLQKRAAPKDGPFPIGSAPGFPGRCQRQKCAKAEEQQRDHRIQPKGIASLGRYDFSRVRLLGPDIGDNGMAPSRDVAGFVPFGNQFLYGVGFRLTELKRRFSLIGLEPFLHRRFESGIAGQADRSARWPRAAGPSANDQS